MSYYDRDRIRLVDGGTIFKTEEDKRHEDEASALLAKAWGCECVPFGALSAIDWYFVRNGRMIGVGELKSRSHEKMKYPTVYLNVRKWIALLMASQGLSVPAVFVVRFSDSLDWIKVAAIDASRLKIGGCKTLVKSDSDIEPVIEIPVGQLKQLVSLEAGEGHA